MDKRCKYNWEEIQLFYDDNHSVRECMQKFGMSSSAIMKAHRKNKLKTRSHTNSMKLLYQLGKGNLPDSRTPEARKRLSELARKRGWGGDKPTKKFLYNGFKLCSSYELRTAIVLDNAKIKWVKPKTTFGWTDDNGIVRTYHPDLYIVENHIYLDPKNSYCIKRDREKIKRAAAENATKIYMVPIETIQKWEKTGFNLTDLVAP